MDRRTKFIVVALFAALALGAFVVLMARYERKENARKAPGLAAKWLGGTPATVHCDDRGFCDVIPPQPAAPYRLDCRWDQCQLITP